MNKPYLENLLLQAKSLGVADVKLAEDLKIKTSEAFLKLFPSEYVNAGNISRLEFDYNPRIYDFGTRVKEFNIARQKLISMIEAKLDLLNSREEDMKTVGPPKIPNLYTTKIKSLEQQIEFQLNQLSGKDRQIKLKELEIEKINQKLTGVENKFGILDRMDKWKNTAFWALIISVITGTFFFGLYVGTTKYDKEKLEMVDEVRTLKDSLKTITGHFKKK